MKKVDFKLVNKQYELNQVAIKLFKAIKTSDGYNRLSYHLRVFINQILLKNQDLIKNLNDEGLLKDNLVNEKLGKEKNNYDYETVASFLHVTNLLVQIHQLLLTELESNKFLNSQMIKEINPDNLVVKNLIDQDEIINLFDRQLKPLLTFGLYENFYRIVLKVNDKKSYLVVDLDLRRFDDDGKKLIKNTKQALTFIDQGLNQLRVFINQCVDNESEHEGECNVSQMTISFYKHFDNPLVKVFGNGDYKDAVQNGNNEEQSYHLLFNEHEPYEDCLFVDCQRATLNCLFDNGIYYGQRLIGTGLNFQLVKNNHYQCEVANFMNEDGANRRLKGKFPSFYQVINFQEFIIIDSQGIQKQIIVSSTKARRRGLEPSLLKNYLIGVYIGDCENEQEIQLRLDEISSDCKGNDLVQGGDFSNSFDKLEVVALKK